MSEKQPKVPVSSFGGVVDRVERRIYKVDRWRLPTPHGVSVRVLLYAVACLAAVGVMSALPVIGLVLAPIPDSVRWVALPLLGAWALSAWQIDGRAPHHALVSALRFLSRPRELAGLRPCPRDGTEMAPVHELCIAPSGDEARYRAGVVRGPANVLLRYPAQVVLEGAKGEGPPSARAAQAKRLRVRGAQGGRPLPAAVELHIPKGRAVIFE
jgi:hypothetical protein